MPLQEIAEKVAAGRLKAKPSRIFRFEEIRKAHRVMEANEAGGKMVVVHDCPAGGRCGEARIVAESYARREVRPAEA